MPNPAISFRLSNYQLAVALKILKSLEPNISPSSKSSIVKTIFHDWVAKHSFAKAHDISIQDYDELEQLSSNHSRSMELSTFQQILANTDATNTLNESLGIPSKQAIEAFQQAEWDKIKAETNPTDQPSSTETSPTDEQIEEQINEQISLAQKYSTNNPEPPIEDQSSPSSNHLTEDQPTDSIINTVTDFSISSDLLDQSE